MARRKREKERYSWVDRIRLGGEMREEAQMEGDKERQKEPQRTRDTDI